MNGYAVSEGEVNGRRAARNASALAALPAAVTAALIAMIFIGGPPFFLTSVPCVAGKVRARPEQDYRCATGFGQHFF